MAQSVTLLGCGDVGPIHGPIEHYGSLVRDALLAADIRFDLRPRAFSRTYCRVGASRVSERRRIGKGQIRQPM